MKNDFSKIFNHTNCISDADIENYVFGQISEIDKRRVEVHIAECSMCRDQVEGLMLINNKEEVNSAVVEINRRIKHRIKRNPFVFTARIKRTLSIAASIIILISVPFLINHYLNNTEEEKTAQSTMLDSVTKQESDEFEGDISKAENNVPEEIIADKKENVYKEDEGLLRENTISEKSKTVTYRNESEKPVNEVDNDEGKGKDKIGLGNNDLKKTNINNDVVSEQDDEIKNEVNKDIVVSDIEYQSEEVVVSSGVSSDIKSKKENYKKYDEPESAIETKKSKEEENNWKMNTRSGNKSKNSAARTVTTEDVAPNNYSEAEEQMNLGIQNYNLKNFDEANTNFTNVIQNNPENKDAIFYSAVCSYNTGDYDKAIESFKKLEKTKYSEESEWYQALILQEKGKKEKATEEFRKISGKKGKFSEKATRKLEEIKE